MNPAVLVVLVPMFFLGGLALAQALHRRKARIPTWRSLAAIARHLGLALREGRTSPYGLPEVHGKVSGRAVRIRTAAGKSAVPVRTVISVTHRIPIVGDAWFSRGTTRAWTLGWPGWPQAWVGGIEKEDAVRITGKRKEAVDQVVRLATGEVLGYLTQIVGTGSWYAGAFRKGRLDAQFAGLGLDEETIRVAMGRLVGLAASLEDQAPKTDLVDLSDGLESSEPDIAARTLDSAVMVIVLAIAGILGALPVVGGGSFESFILLWGTAFALATLAGSRLAASRLSSEEKAILAEFEGRTSVR